MFKLLKYIAITLASLIVLTLIVLGLLIAFVSPERLKPVITSQVFKATGRQLIIDGKMSWTVYPYLGIKVGHMQLGNPANFTQKDFVELDGATVGVRALPLMHGQIESSGVILTGMNLTLIKNARGEVNWTFPQKNPTQTEQSTDGTVSSGNKANFGVAISAVDISNAKVTYMDEQAHQSYDVTNLELHAKNINLLEPFPLKGSLDFAAKNPASSGHIALTSDVALNVDAQIYSFRNLDFKLQAQQQVKKVNLELEGNLIANLNDQTLQWTDFQGKVANVSLAGKLSVAHLNSNPVTTGHMTIQPFDLKETLQELGENTDSLQIAKDARGSLDFSAAGKTTKVQANLTIDTLQAAKLKLTQVNMQADFENGVLSLPLTASLYQGALSGQAHIDLNSSVPHIAIHGKLTNVQVEPMLKDLGGANQKISAQGAGNIVLDITTSGSGPDAVLQNMNGTSQFSITNGAITGLDMGYLVDSAYALVKKQSMPKNNNQTNFGNMTGTIDIHNGIATNNDLLVDSPRFTTHGSGTINLVKQDINYIFQVTVKQRGDQKDDTQNLYGIALPITITGSLENPNIRLDSSALAKEIAQQQMQRVTNQVQEKIKDKIQDQLKQEGPVKANQLLNNLLGH